MKNVLFTQFETDPKLEREGVKVEYLGDDEDANKTPPTFTIARAGGANVAYDTMMDQKLKPLRRRLQADNVNNKELEKITKEVWIATVLKGWQNVKDQNGDVLEFSQNAATELFNKLPELYEDLRQQSLKVSMYRAANLDEAAKNS
jgi:hypothetical protein